MLGHCKSCSLRLGVALGTLALLLAFASAQNPARSPPLFPRRPDYGRIGLCPYVKRLVYITDHDPHKHMGNSGEPPSLCGNFCINDHECPGTQKCCPTHCGYACFEPVFIAD